MPYTQGNLRNKEPFWDNVFHLVSSNLQNAMVIFAGDRYEHVGCSNADYDGTHGGFGYSSSNADSSRILEFADG